MFITSGSGTKYAVFAQKGELTVAMTLMMVEVHQNLFMLVRTRYANLDKSHLSETDVPKFIYAAAEGKSLHSVRAVHGFNTGLRVSDLNAKSAGKLYNQAKTALFDLLVASEGFPTAADLHGEFRKHFIELVESHFEGKYPYKVFPDVGVLKTNAEMHTLITGGELPQKAGMSVVKSTVETAEPNVVKADFSNLKKGVDEAVDS